MCSKRFLKVESGLDQAPQQTCSQSTVGGVSTHDDGDHEKEGDLKKEIERWLTLQKSKAQRNINGKCSHQAR